MKKLIMLFLAWFVAFAAFAVKVEFEQDATKIEDLKAVIAYHGEDLHFVIWPTENGQRMNIGAASASLCWQTADMEDSWIVTNVSVMSKQISNATKHYFDFTFGKGAEGQADDVRFFIRWRSGGESPGEQYNPGVDDISYRLNFAVRWIGSPGENPTQIPLPRRTLDFGSTDVQNAPYYTKQEADSLFVNEIDYQDMYAQLVTEITGIADVSYASHWFEQWGLEQIGSITNAINAINANTNSVSIDDVIASDEFKQTLKTFKYWPQVEKPENVGEYMVYVGYGQTANTNAPDGLKPGKTYQISRPYTNQYVATEANFLKELATENWAEYYFAKKSRKINGKPLSGDITLTAEDVGAHPNDVGYITITDDTDELSVELEIAADEDPYISYNWTSLETAGEATWLFPTNSGRLALRDDIASAAITNAGAVAAAAADAAATYLPLSGGTVVGDMDICGNLYFNNLDTYIAFAQGRVCIGDDAEHEHISFCRVEVIDEGLDDPTYVYHTSNLKPDGSDVATSNMVERMADYALTGGAVLKSGEIAAIETATNLTVRLDFAANGRGADCGAYVENTAASNVTLAVAGDFHVACAGDEPLTLPKMSTNIVYFCRVKTDVVVVSRQEIK